MSTTGVGLFRTGAFAAALVFALGLGGCKCNGGECGDGTVDDGEECDDANQQSGDGCSAVCLTEVAAETDCANGADDDGDGNTDCDDADCNADPACAGMVETDCTNGMDDDGDGDTDCADTNCALDPACMPQAENCTNGMDDDGDGATDCADADCTANPACAAACGDGTVDAGEQCDDGNTTAGDGCDAACMFESTGCTAATPTDVTGNIDGANVTGTTDPADPSFYRGGCDTAGADGPEVVFTFTITATTSLHISTVDPGTSFDTILFLRAGDCDATGAEIDCDNDVAGNLANLTEYNLAPGVYFLFLDGNNGNAGDYELSIVTATCGDGIVDGPLGESCDDGNTTAGDGCDAACAIEPVMCTMGGPFTDVTGNIDGAAVTGTFDATVDPADYMGSCGGGGPEQIFELILTDGQNVRISTNDPGTLANTVLYLRAALCDDPGSEVDCDGPMTSNDATITIIGATAGTYWLFVDNSGAGPDGAWVLNLVTPSCGDGVQDGALGELCDDGNTTDGDGCSALCGEELAMCFPADDTVTPTATLMLDTSMDTDDVDAPCNFFGGGNDHFIQFDVPTDGMVLTVDYDQMGNDHVLALIADSGGICSWLECTDLFFLPDPGTVSSAPLAAGTYYLVVDAVGGFGAGPIDVTLTLM